MSEKDIDDKYDDYSDIDRDLSKAKNNSFSAQRSNSSQSLTSHVFI